MQVIQLPPFIHCFCFIEWNKCFPWVLRHKEPFGWPYHNVIGVVVGSGWKVNLIPQPKPIPQPSAKGSIVTFSWLFLFHFVSYA